jgi:hypothetical protein
MAYALDMNGPYQLTEPLVGQWVMPRTKGNYALGYSKGSTFYVQYVGRSDNDLHGRLLEHLEKYEEFQYSYARSAQEAYEKECQNYHGCGGPEGKLKNDKHPDCPDGTSLTCLVCGK